MLRQILKRGQNVFREFKFTSTINSSITKIMCWKCGQKLANPRDLFCDKCKHIQKPEQKDNYFKVFQLPPKYNIDVSNLQKQYRTMQGQLHPDKFANSSNEEKSISADYSSLVNNAYHTLSNPMSRAMHLLNLHNESIMESDKSTDNEFLMQIMELNEAVENAQTETELKNLQSQNQRVLKRIEGDLVQMFEKNDIATAKHLVIKMKYFHSVGVKLKEAMGNKGMVD